MDDEGWCVCGGVILWAEAISIVLNVVKEQYCNATTGNLSDGSERILEHAFNFNNMFPGDIVVTLLFGWLLASWLLVLGVCIFMYMCHLYTMWCYTSGVD